MAAYILLGSEEGEKIEFIRKERRKVFSSYPEAEEYTFFGGDEDGEGVSTALMESSLFSSYRFVVVKHFENVKKTDSSWKALEEWGNNPTSDATVIVTSSDNYPTAFPKSFVEAAGKENTITFWEMKEDQKKRWIVENVRKEGFQITQDAIDEILSSVDNNTQEMKNLVSSITNFLRIQNNGTRQITLDTIEAYSVRTKGENGYSLFSALAEGNLEKALMIVSSILLNDSRDLIPALSILSISFRKLEAALMMKKERKSEDDIFRNVTFVSPYSTVGKKPNVGISFREKETYRKAMRYYSLEDATRIVALLGSYDKILKSTSTDTVKITFETLIYSIVVNKGKEEGLSLAPPSLESNYFRN